MASPQASDSVSLTAGRKRVRPNEFDVSDIDSAFERATVHGVITELSPVKPSRKNDQIKYFHAKITDGKKTMRVISISPSLRTELEEFRLQTSPIAFVNCQIKETPSEYRQGQKEFEIIASTKSRVERLSGKEFPLSAHVLQQNNSPVIKLIELNDVANNQHVTTTFKVIEMEPPETITRSGKTLQKKDCTIGDATGRSRLVLWEQNISMFDIGKSYKVDGLTVRMYQDEKYLSVSNEVNIQPVSDIGEIATEIEQKPGIHHQNAVLEGEIVGVLSTDQYLSCLNCKAKINPINEHIGECGKCNFKVKLSKCNFNDTARVIFRAASNGIDHHVTFFHKDIIAVTLNTSGLSLIDKLLNVPPI